MNKYQEALIRVSKSCKALAMEFGDKMYKTDAIALNRLKKLVIKATPKKPIYKDDGTGYHYYFCGNCNARVPLCSNLIDQIKYKYCPYCGREIDWGE